MHNGRVREAHSTNSILPKLGLAHTAWYTAQYDLEILSHLGNQFVRLNRSISINPSTQLINLFAPWGVRCPGVGVHSWRAGLHTSGVFIINTYYIKLTNDLDLHGSGGVGHETTLY